MPHAPDVELAVVGAGPYGLSLVAANPELRSVVFGRPFETWERMDPAMQLRAASDEMNLCAGTRDGTLARWRADTGAEPEEPLRVRSFLSYGRWFTERFVPDLVPEDVIAIAEDARGRLLVSSPTRTVSARAVIVAVGITPFPYAPDELEALVDCDQVRFVTNESACIAEPGSRVAVIGGGQSAVEAAVRSAEAGAHTTLIARRQINWFADREPFTERGPVGQRVYKLLYPAVGYGPPPLNRLVLEPDLFAMLPSGISKRLTRRLLRPGASPWLRAAVDGAVAVHEGSWVTSVDVNGEIHMTLSHGDVLSVDRLLLATGHRFCLDRLDYLGPALREKIEVRDGWPVLDRWFRSTDPRVSFVGYAAEGRFGPISRFVLGVAFTTERVGQSLRGLQR